jgi:hypothetical protein
MKSRMDVPNLIFLTRWKMDYYKKREERYYAIDECEKDIIKNACLQDCFLVV